MRQSDAFKPISVQKGLTRTGSLQPRNVNFMQKDTGQSQEISLDAAILENQSPPKPIKELKKSNDSGGDSMKSAPRITLRNLESQGTIELTNVDGTPQSQMTPAEKVLASKKKESLLVPKDSVIDQLDLHRGITGYLQSQKEIVHEELHEEDKDDLDELIIGGANEQQKLFVVEKSLMLT